MSPVPPWAAARVLAWPALIFSPAVCAGGTFPCSSVWTWSIRARSSSVVLKPFTMRFRVAAVTPAREPISYMPQPKLCRDWI